MRKCLNHIIDWPGLVYISCLGKLINILHSFTTDSWISCIYVEDYYCVAMNELNWFPADTEVSFYLLQCYCFKQYTLTKHQWSRVYNPGFYCWSSAANCLNLCKYWNVKQTMRIRVYNCGWIVHDYLFTSDCFCSFLLFNLIIKTIKQVQMIIEHCHQRMLLPQIVQ